MDHLAPHLASHLLLRIQGEFLEMPGLRLTEPQARRLWGLEPLHCSAVLGVLIDAGFLLRTRDGSVMRVEHAKPLKVEEARSPAARAVHA